MISNPSLILTFTANDLEAGHGSVQTVTGDDLLTRSISIEHRLLDGLKPSSDKVRLSIRKGAAVTEDIIRTDGDIHAVLMDGSTTLFTGYVSANFSWSITDYGEETLSITIEDTGTRLLGKSFIKEGFHLFLGEAYKAVEAIAERAGITISPDSVRPMTEIVRSVEGDESCKDLLTELLYEIGYVYAFDEYGEMYLHKVSVSSLSGIPTVDSSSLVSVGGTAISLRKKIRQYRTARVTFQRLGEADDYLVYRDTTGQGDGHPYCYHELKGGEHFDGTENYTPSGDETRTPAYIEAVNAASETKIVGSNEIVAVTDLRTVFTAASGSISATCSLAGGKYIKVHAENTGRTPTYLTRLDAYGSILYARDENVVIASGGALTTDEGSPLKEEMAWIHDEESAKAHANLLASYHRNAGSEYTFTSFMNLAPGSVVHLEDDVFTGLSVDVLIVSKVTTDESDVYQYGAVGVSVFDLDAGVISETFVKGDTDMRGEAAVTYFLDSTADVIRSDAAVTVKPFRRAGSSKADNIVCTLRLEGAADYGTDKEDWILISEEDASSLAFTPASYGAYRVTMIVSDEEVFRKTIPRVYDGEKGEAVSITASREIVEYYADGYPVDETDITVTAHANGSIRIYIGDEEEPAATGDGEAVITIKPSDYLDEASALMIRAVSGKAEDTVTIVRHTLQGSLEISSSTLSFAYYADIVPHDEAETATVTVKAMNYKSFPTLRLDGTPIETPDEHEYTVEISVNELLQKESIELRAYVHTRSEALTIIRKTDRGVLTLVSDRYSFGYYADNEPHNAAEAATISIAQEGYSGMPDLYVRGLKTDYADGTYSLQSSMLRNTSSIILEIRKGPDRASIEIRKELDTAAIRLFLSRDYVSYYHDNVRISGDIICSVIYSGLFQPPKVKAGNTDIPLTDGKGTIPAALLDAEEATALEVTAYSERAAYASDTAVIRKEMLQLSLSFTLSAAQFGYGSDGEISPESRTIKNTTSGLSDNSKPVLKLAGIPVTWSDEGTFIITPDMVEGRYLAVEIVYGDETRSAIITKTFDGKILRLSADSQFFRLSSSGKPVAGQEITLRVHTQGIRDEVSWTDNKGLQIPSGTMIYGISADELQESLFDGTPFIFSITADGLSDTIMIGFVRDGADGASAGTYIGASISAPETKEDGTKITSGDFYLDVSNPASPVPYRWKDGMWQAVTADDPDWSYIASATLIDVMRYSASLISISAYYGYFQMLAANKAFIDSLGAETITIKDGGAIESESYQETDGLEGFHIGEDGITAASGTWKGAFANGLSFIPPTEAHITADMSEKDAYLALKKAGITEGTYFEGAQTHWIRKDDGTVFPNPPAFFAPWISPEKDPLFHFLSLAIEKKEFAADASGDTMFSIAESDLFGYILDAFPIASDRWLLVLADVAEEKNGDGTSIYTLMRKGLYILTKGNLEKILSSPLGGDAEDIIAAYLVKQTGIPSSWSEGEISYPMPMMDFIPYTDYVTGMTWLISQESTPALYSININDPSDTQFRAEGTASVTLPDGTKAAGLYFSRGLIDVSGYLRTRTIDGVDHTEASVILLPDEASSAYAVIRSRDMMNWTVSSMADGETLGAVLEDRILYPMDFMDDGGSFLMSLITYDGYGLGFAFGRYDLETATLEIRPHEMAAVKLYNGEFPFMIGSYGLPVYRYPLIRIGTRIYGSLSGLTFFSYDTSTGIFTDLTRILTSLDISTSESSSPDEFVAARSNPLLRVEVPASESPDHKAVMVAGPDLVIASMTPIPDSERIFLVFLASGCMAIPAEYDTASGKLAVYPYASPESPPISESMMASALFSGDTVLLGINGILMFRKYSLSIPPFTVPNLRPSDIAELMAPKPAETDTATMELSGSTEPIIPYTAYPVNEDTFLLGLAGESVMGFYTMGKAGFEKLASSSPADPSPYITLFDQAYPYMTILFYDYDGRKTHFWSMTSHTVFDMDTGSVISTVPFTIAAPDGTVLEGIIWSYGMYARAPVTRREGKFQATVMIEGRSSTAFYHAESIDGNTWTAELMRQSEDSAEDIYAGSVDLEESWLCYRYSQDGETMSMVISLCLVHKDGTEDTVLASESCPIIDESSMIKAIIRPSLIETGGRFYAGLPYSVVSWAPGESSAASVYSTDNILTDLIESDNGLIIEEYIENAMRFRTISLVLSSGAATELKTVSGRMFDYICARSIFLDGGTRVSTHLLGDAGAEDMSVGLMADADGITYSVTIAGIDNITEWLTGVFESGGISRFLHILALYTELFDIVDGSYDAMNETGRAIGVPDAEIEESAFIIADSAVVDVRERDSAIEIRLLPFSYGLDETIRPFSELTMQPSSLFYVYFGKCWYIGNPDIVEPFLAIHKDSEEPVGVTFHWNFPAQLTSTSSDALLRAPILRDGAMNSSADAAIPESFIDDLPED